MNTISHGDALLLYTLAKTTLETSASTHIKVIRIMRKNDTIAFEAGKQQYSFIMGITVRNWRFRIHEKFLTDSDGFSDTLLYSAAKNTI